MHPTNKHLLLFKNLFKAREDVFAVRWEKGTKSGYMRTIRPGLLRQILIEKLGGGMFFDRAYAAVRGRKVFTMLLEKSGMVSALDKMYQDQRPPDFPQTPT